MFARCLRSQMQNVTGFSNDLCDAPDFGASVIVYDRIPSGATPINLNAAAPIPILMVGLQGSGKTTTSAKIALYLKDKQRKKVLLASLDTQRPAAQLQLAQLAEHAGVGALPIIGGEAPVQIARRAMDTGRRESFDRLRRRGTLSESDVIDAIMAT